MPSTLGIDLASQPANTAGCLIRWDHGRATVEELQINLTDDAIIELAVNANKVGIDAPFGWPEPFVAFVSGHQHGGSTWPDEKPDWRHALCYRQTDRCVTTATCLRPLSVSADRIAWTTMRCARLLTRLDVHDRSGAERAVEVYPAVALKQWGLPHRGYKGGKNQKKLATLVERFCKDQPWLEVSDEDAKLLARNDHAFDALISSLVARAVMLNRTLPITQDDRHLAATEGWIHIPEPGSLAQLIES